MRTFEIITLFPQLFESHLKELPFSKSVQKDLTKINFHNPREFSTDDRKTIDFKPYGGGVGMLMMVEPIYKTLHKIFTPNYEKVISDNKLHKVKTHSNEKIILLTPKGERFTQKKAEELKEYDKIALICGRYEGFDARVKELANIEELSIGDFVLSGGELPALVVMESIIRLIPGVLEKEEAHEIESFSKNTLEYPQYTKPRNFKGLDVPEVLLSGDHKKIEEWRRSNSKPIQ